MCAIINQQSLRPKISTQSTKRASFSPSSKTALDLICRRRLQNGLDGLQNATKGSGYKRPPLPAREERFERLPLLIGEGVSSSLGTLLRGGCVDKNAHAGGYSCASLSLPCKVVAVRVRTVDTSFSCAFPILDRTKAHRLSHSLFPQTFLDQLRHNATRSRVALNTNVSDLETAHLPFKSVVPRGARPVRYSPEQKEVGEFNVCSFLQTSFLDIVNL